MLSAVLIISLLLFCCYAGLLLYYRRSWLSLPGFEAPQASGNTRISVIIPARNEEANIGACLTSVLAQTYPEQLYEVIVVDDHSTDGTAAVINAFGQPRIRYIDLGKVIDQPLNSYKKKAIETGVRMASGELIVTTDADCIAGPEWLRTIAAFYEEHQPQFIAAPVSLTGSKHFIEIFQLLDFMTLQGITGAAVHKQMHNMCNGANLAYTKEAFEAVEGFTGIDSIASGDDMLLMHKIYTRYPDRVLFLKSKEAIISTAAVKTTGAFFNQRIRWASKAGHYSDKRIFGVLLLVYLFNLSLLILPLLAVFAGTLSIIHYSLSIILYPLSIYLSWLILLALKTITELFFLYPVAGFFSKRNLLGWFPLMQPFHILYTVIAGFLGSFGSYQWKGRKVK